MAQIVVFGGSRGVGLETVKLALDAGHKVRAVARAASTIGLSHSDLERLDGSALDPAIVAKALEGADIVIQALGVAASAGVVRRGTDLFSRSTTLLLPAMAAAGVRRLICLTGYGAGDSRSTYGCLSGLAFTLMLGRIYDDKTVQEGLIRQSGLDWTIARPGILTNGSHTGRYKVLVERRQWRQGLISRADVADFLVRQIEDDTLIGKTPVLVY